MPPRVIYWTGTWAPEREAHSIEIELLRAANRRSCPVLACSPGNRSGLDLNRSVCRLSARDWWVYRALQVAFEPYGDVSHVFGSLSAWHLAKAIGKRPTVFTVTLSGKPAHPHLADRITLFAVESEALAKELLGYGIAERKVRVVYPGVDLDRFRPTPAPPTVPFRILFASSPVHVREFEARGIPLLVEVARRRPEVDIVCRWRTWDDAAQTAQALYRLAPPANFVVLHGDVAGMEHEFAKVHATVVPFAQGFGKSCPNSAIEGLACGRPALLSTAVGIADLVDRNRAGIRVTDTVEGFVEAIDRLRQSYETYASHARQLAEAQFSLRGFRRQYAQIYCELADSVWRGEALEQLQGSLRLR